VLDEQRCWLVTDISDHFEAHCGPILRGWSKGEAGRRLPVQMAVLDHSPVSGARVIATLGLSQHLLQLGESSHEVRLELMMMFRTAEGERNLPAVLSQVALGLLEDHRGVWHGEVLGPRGPLVPGSTMSALCAAQPVYFPDSFAAFSDDELGRVVVVWLVPISESEARFVRSSGWRRFEALLLRDNPDVLDFFRRPIV